MEHQNMVVWKIIVYHQIIVSATESSYKMAVKALSKMGLKELDFLSKNSDFVHFGLYNLFQILPACIPNTYQIMYGETLDLQC